MISLTRTLSQATGICKVKRSSWPHRCPTRFPLAATACCPVRRGWARGGTRIGRVDEVTESDIWTWNGTTWFEGGTGLRAIDDEVGMYDAALGDVVVYGLAASGPLRSTTWGLEGRRPTARLPTRES